MSAGQAENSASRARSREPGARRGGKLVGVALALGTILVAFAAAEVGLRLAGFDPIGKMTSKLDQRFIIQESEDPVLVYEFAPGTTGDLWGSRVEINADGLRDRDLPAEKPSGTTRVLAVGDSVTFGVEMDQGERWSERLEQTWRDWGLDVEVLNLGVPGYDTAQEVRFIERKGLKYEPDQVVLCFCVNDLETVSFDFEAVVALKRFRSGLLSWSRVAQWATQRLDKIRQAESASTIRDRERIRAAAADITPDPELDALVQELRDAIARAGDVGPERKADPDWFRRDKFRTRLLLYTEPGRLQLVRDAFEKLAALAGEHGFGVTVFVAPFLYEDFDKEGLHASYAIVRHLAESAGFDFVDVYPTVSEADLSSLKTKNPNDYVHLNAQGHRLMARALLAATRDWFQ